MAKIEDNFEVEGHTVHYQKYGKGSEPILLLPGVLGTAETDYFAQIEGDEAFNLRKYTLVVMELQGWGRSRPPAREYYGNENIYESDVVCAISLMKHLGYETFSVIGWSESSKLALLLAIIYPSRIEAVVAISPFIYITRRNLLPMVSTRNVKLWNDDRLQRYLKIYGFDDLQKLWTDYIEYSESLIKKVEILASMVIDGTEKRISIHDRLLPGLKQIRCPVLLLLGDQDQVVGIEHSQYCLQHIANSELKLFPKASHNLHQTEAGEFRRLVQKFLDESIDW